jgi:hypothetical protein
MVRLGSCETALAFGDIQVWTGAYYKREKIWYLVSSITMLITRRFPFLRRHTLKQPSMIATYAVRRRHRRIRGGACAYVTVSYPRPPYRIRRTTLNNFHQPNLSLR